MTVMQNFVSGCFSEEAAAALVSMAIDAVSGEHVVLSTLLDVSVNQVDREEMTIVLDMERHSA